MKFGRQKLQFISYQPSLDLYFCIYLVIYRYIHMNIHVLHLHCNDHDCEHHVPDFLELSSKAIFCQTLKSKKQEKKKTCIIELIHYPKLLETGLHSLKLTSPLKMMVSNRNLLFQVYSQGQAVSFREGSCEKSCYVLLMQFEPWFSVKIPAKKNTG